MKQKVIELQGEIDKPITIVGDFNIISIINRTYTQKISKDIVGLNSTINELA